MKSLAGFLVTCAFLISAQPASAEEPTLPDVILHPPLGVSRREFAKTHSKTYDFGSGQWRPLNSLAPKDPICERISDPVGYVTYCFLNGVIEDVEYAQTLGPGSSKHLVLELTERLGKPFRIDSPPPKETIQYHWRLKDRYVLLDLEKSLFGEHNPTVLIASPDYVKFHHLESLFQ
jgi:hypothetical protein